MANLVLNQPPVNSLTTEFLTEIADTLKEIEKDENVKALVIASKFHGKVYSAGLHIPDLHNRFKIE